MKTAISIPDAIFEEAERVAKRSGMSRNELYARAIDKYVKSERILGVRQRLDAVYGHDDPESKLDIALAAIQAASIDDGNW